MDWDEIMNELNNHQEELGSLVVSCRRIYEGQYRTDYDDRIQETLGSLVTQAQRRAVPWPLLLGAVVAKQHKFNQNVMSLLTDLDHRKDEAN